jgi:methionyl-tRNA synthetase
MKRTLITSALPYANGYIHLGHMAGAYLPADIYARFCRLSGREVLYVCGSDEHGVAINIAAEKEGVSPKEIIDKYHFDNKTAFHQFGMSFDQYSRTSIPEHHELAREFFEDFLNKGFLAEKTEEQFYDQKAKMFLPDRYVEGECPNCGKDHARGDQCDSCGAYYSQTELKNPISTVTGETPIAKKTTHWYFKFGEFQDFLENYIESNSGNENPIKGGGGWKDNVLQQTRSWLKAGLTDRAITRDLDWGVKINDLKGMDEQKAKGKALYVWFDAVLGYISATKKYYEDNPDRENEFGGWKKWWQSEDTDYIAFIGKDNIVFHTLIFPAMLHARKDADNPYILPKNIPAHEFLNLEGQKFSKSRSWSIDLRDFLTENSDGASVDQLRYTLASNFPETKDADFTWRDFQARVNNELASIFGNFINRSLTFLHKNFGGKVPSLGHKSQGLEHAWRMSIDSLAKGEIFPSSQYLNDNDELLLTELYQNITQSADQFDKFRFRDGLVSVMNVARAANKYFNDEEPWKTIKTDEEKAAKTLWMCCQVANSLSLIFSPIIPNTCKRIQVWMGEENPLTGNQNEDIQIGADLWIQAANPHLLGGQKIEKPEILFARVEDSFVESEIAKLGDKKVEEETNLISFDDFMKVELRTAKVISAEKIKKSKKLLKLKVSLGDLETRQIVAGIAQDYTPEDILNKMVIVVANLTPAKLMGEKSEGMLLAANMKNGSLKVITIDGVGEGETVG